MKKNIVLYSITGLLLGIFVFLMVTMYIQLQSLKKQINTIGYSEITIPGDSLVFRNKKGVKVAELLATMNGGGLEIFNDKEKRLFSLIPWENGGAIMIYNNQNNLACYLSTSDLGSIFGLNDFLGKSKAGIIASTEGGNVLTNDKDGKITGILGKANEQK